MTTRALVMASLAAASLAALSACKDPVHDAEVDALGPEAPGVHPGPFHRPGQPCLVCHGGEGPGGSTFSIAGTIFQYPDQDTPLPDAIVSLGHGYDMPGGNVVPEKQLISNCAGNFYAETSDYDPSFPLVVQVDYPNMKAAIASQQMTSAIGRDGGCGFCHFPDPGVRSPGRIYMDLNHVTDFGTFQACP